MSMDLTRQREGRVKSLLARTEEIRTVMDEAGYNPIEAMMEIACDDNVNVKTRALLHKELATYYAPKQRAVDMNMKVSGGINITVNKFGSDEPQKPPGSTVEGEIVELGVINGGQQINE